MWSSVCERKLFIVRHSTDAQDSKFVSGMKEDLVWGVQFWKTNQVMLLLIWNPHKPEKISNYGIAIQVKEKD
jgi:hypothetical protein